MQTARTKYLPRLSQQYELNISIGYPNSTNQYFPRLSEQYELNICLGYPKSTK